MDHSPKAGRRSIERFGYYEDPNVNKRSTMEDVTVCVDKYLDDPSKAFFAVYDGHGGREIAELCGRVLHRHLKDLLVDAATEMGVHPSDLSGENVSAAITEAIRKTDMDAKGNKNGRFQGCTACFCYIDRAPYIDAPDGRIWFVSVGDSRAVLVSYCPTGGRSVSRVTRDHKPTDQDEMERVKKAGGFVSAGRVLGIIAVSRSMGDHAMKPYLTSDPYIYEHAISPDDGFFVIACDGVWDVLSDDQAGAITESALVRASGDPAEAARSLVREAVRLDTNDNVSALVVTLGNKIPGVA